MHCCLFVSATKKRNNNNQGTIRSGDGKPGRTVDRSGGDAHNDGFGDHLDAHEAHEGNEQFSVAVVHSVYAEYKDI